MKRKLLHFLSLLLLMLCSTSAWADTETVFEWTGSSERLTSATTETNSYGTITGYTTKDFTATEGTINVSQSSNYTLKCMGKSDFSTNQIVVTLKEGETLKEGDVLTINGFSNSDKKDSYPAIKFSSSYTEVLNSTFANMNSSSANYNDGKLGDPKTITLGAGAEGVTSFAISRGATSTNFFITSISITRGTDDRVVSSISASGIKIGGVKVEDATFDTNNTYVATEGYVSLPTVSIIKHTVYTDESETDSDVNLTMAKDGAYFVGTATINEVVYTVKIPVLASNERLLTSIIFSNGFNGFVTDATEEANGSVAAYYMEGESAPTISSITVSDKATHSVDGNTITVTAEDGSIAVYDVTVTPVSPYTGTGLTFDGTETWIKTGNKYVETNGDKTYYAWVINKQATNDNRIRAGRTRIYYFIGPSQSITLTNDRGTALSTARNIKVYVNGVENTTVTSMPEYNETTPAAITINTGAAAMIEISSNQTSGDTGWGKIDVTKIPSTTYSITYVNNGHGTAPTTVESATELPAELPTMTEDGWTFDGWFTNEDLTDPAVAGSALTANITLYAKWTQAAAPEPTEWESYELVLNKEGILTADEISTKEQTTFGIALDEEGKAIRVAANATDAIAVITGNYHNDHGMNSFSMTAKVPGAVKVTVGTCTYGTTKLKINGTQVADDSKKDGCWKNDTKYVVSGIYNGEAGEITITTGTYTPYIKIEKLASQPQEFKVTYNCEEEDLQGKVPAAFTVIEGNKFTVPANRTMYREGWTLSEWTVFTSIESEEAIATLKPGDEYTPTSDCYLYPIWNENNYTLADREEAVTVKWDFQQKNGAPILSSEGKDGEIYVTQVNLKVLDGLLTFPIDVKLDFSTVGIDGKSGKVNNAAWSDWCQMNPNTKFTIPSCKGAKVSIESMNATTTTTIDGLTDYTTAGGVVTAEIANKADAIDIVIGDGSYFRYIQVVLPVVETPAGKTKEADLINTDMTDLSAVTSGDANTLVITTTGSKEDITFTFHNTTVEPTYKNTDKFDLTGAMVAQKNGQATITTSAFANITKVTYVHGATGSNRGWGLKVKGDGDTDWVTLSDAVAYPSKGATVTVDVNRTNVQLQWYNLVDAQNAMMFNLNIKGNITVYGEEYEVAAQANNADAGSATIYPAGGTYTEGDEITLTATENFGYDFVNWTNAAGDEVSTEAKFKVEVKANETYTANFVQVNTYALNVDIEGGANDYMISYNPAPTVVDNKNMYEADTKVTITAAENPILTFNSWSNGETSKEIEVTMNEDIDLTATYSAVDFIVGWDFYKAGNNGRNADFFAADNDAVSLVLRNEAGNTYGWLDKSQLAAGGYEGRPGAVNWKNDAAIGTYYWQTKVNAEAFTDLKVKTAMVYNYNAYQKYDVQASLNGTDWETIGSVNMTGAKAWTDLEASFPATYNNQKEVYVRWIADKESAIDGTTSQNDGACLGATYITGTAKLVDDGTAPVLVSTVPAEGADNASANGKIVLTFDEKVKVAEGTKATLGDNQLTPVVSGKTVTFEYKGLDYATEYTFSLPANSVADLTDNYLAESITINFQTKQKPAIEKGIYDAIVTNGEEMKAAIAQANSRADKTKRFRIFVMPGTHKIPVYDTKVTVNVELKGGLKEERTYAEPRTYITADNISIIGADYETTTITNTTPTETFEGQFGEANISEGIGNNDVFQISAKNTYFQGVTVKTGLGDARGRDIAVQDKGDKTIFKDARLWGYQDTYTNNNSNGRFYFEGGVVRGRTDYLCGKGDIWFEGVTLQQCGQGGYPIVPSQPKQYGWIFNGCTLTPETSDVTCTLGRPWGSGTPIAILINTTMEVVPGAEGWSEMSGGWPARFAEYNSTTKTGTVIDLSQRKKTFGNEEKGIHENCNNPVLTAEEAAEYSISKVMGNGDDWDPTALTEQASAPTNVAINGSSLTWDDSNYVFCWAVIKNGEIVDFTTTPSYTVDEPTATWSVRAANEMGGLGEATEASSTATAIADFKVKENANAPIYNIAGQRVAAGTKGILIQNGVKRIQK